MSTQIKGGGNTAGNANVSDDFRLKVEIQPTVVGNESKIGAVKYFSENDDGEIIGIPYLQSPETDDDHRLRTAQDVLLDDENFDYTAQNTGKHTYTTTTLAMSLTTAGLTTNSGNITTTNTGSTFGTYAEFPIFGSNNLYAEFKGGFSSQPTSNMTIDFGLFRRGTTTQFTPTDGAYFRLNASGLFGVINNNGVEATTSVFPFSYVNNKKYQFIITISRREVEFWIDNVLYATIKTPIGQGQPFMSDTLPLSIRHANSGVAGGIINFILNSYTVSIGGSSICRTLSELGNAVCGSYQGLSGGTMGQLVSGTVTTGTLVKPSAVVPSNTALTAGLGSSLGGRSWETYTTPLATNTDGIISIYLNPLGTVSIPGKRLKINGVKMSGVIQTVIAGGPFTQEWYLIFGGTAISLATAEGTNAKPCRRIFLPEFTQNITANQAVQTQVQQPSYYASFSNPIYVNPGEYVGLSNNWFGTAPTAGVVAYSYQFDYGWE